jgi:hypothetical protein
MWVPMVRYGLKGFENVDNSGILKVVPSSFLMVDVSHPDSTESV